MYAGIDTHKDTLAVAVVDHLGTIRAQARYPNTHPGYLAIAELLAHHRVQRIGIEGSANYGRCISAHLALDTDHPGACGRFPPCAPPGNAARSPAKAKPTPSTRP